MKDHRCTSVLPMVIVALAGLVYACQVADSERLDGLEQEVDSLRQQVDELASLLPAAARNRIIVVVRSPSSDPRLLVPREKLVCNPPRVNCGNDAVWKLVGTPLDSDWRVVISEKADSPYEGCFTPPTAEGWILTAGDAEESSGLPDAACRPNATWEYQVVLENPEGEAVQTIDPVLVVNWS